MYSFFCKDCGDFFSGTKEEVAKYKKEHKIVNMVTKVKYCSMQITKRKTLARPWLAKMIDAEIALEKSA